MNRIENHPHRDELRADFMQDNVYNTFSDNSKKIIHDVGNVEYFELCETTPKAQCSYCLSCWTKGIVYCTCGNCLCHAEFHASVWIEVDSMPYGFRILWSKRDAHTELDMGNLRSRTCITKPFTRGNDAERRKMPNINITLKFWTASWEAQRIANHKKDTGVTKQNVKHTKNWLKNITRIRSRRPNICVLHQNGASSSTFPDPADRRLPDPTIAQQLNWKNQLYQESGESQEKPIPPQKQHGVRENSQFSTSYPSSAHIDKKTGWKFWPSSSSSSSNWWQSSQWNWNEQ